jgi:hypothetical protein
MSDLFQMYNCDIKVFFIKKYVKKRNENVLRWDEVFYGCRQNKSTRQNSNFAISWKGTRKNKSLLCARPKTHGKVLFYRVSSLKHTKNPILPCVLHFAVHLRRGTRQNIPWQKAGHTTNLGFPVVFEATMTI